MDFAVCLEDLVRHWTKGAAGDEAKPIDLRLAGLIYALGVGSIEPNPEAAEAWFRHARTAREYARYRAALEPEWQPREDHGAETFDNAEYSIYDLRMFDEDMRRHLLESVRSGADELELGLSTEQKDALAQHVIKTFESLLSLSGPANDDLQVPEAPPEVYAAREVNEELRRKETIREFLIRVYAKEIEAGIIEDSDLSALDRGAYSALHSWNVNHPREPFHLVKKQALIDREIKEQLEAARAALQHSPKAMRRQEIRSAVPG